MADEKFEDFDFDDDEMVEKKSLKDKACDLLGTGLAWCAEHWQYLVLGFTGFFGLLVGVADTAKKNERKRNDHELRYRSIYDPKHRHHVIAKKDIKPNQQRQIDRRIDAGESIYDVCESLGVKLKR